jgi:hypothetical protein
MAQTGSFDGVYRLARNPYFLSYSSCVIFKMARSIFYYSSLYAFNDLKVRICTVSKIKENIFTTFHSWRDEKANTIA